MFDTVYFFAGIHGETATIYRVLSFCTFVQIALPWSTYFRKCEVAILRMSCSCPVPFGAFFEIHLHTATSAAAATS